MTFLQKSLSGKFSTNTPRKVHFLKCGLSVCLFVVVLAFVEVFPFGPQNLRHKRITQGEWEFPFEGREERKEGKTKLWRTRTSFFSEPKKMKVYACKHNVVTILQVLWVKLTMRQNTGFCTLNLGGVRSGNFEIRWIDPGDGSNRHHPTNPARVKILSHSLALIKAI